MKLDELPEHSQICHICKDEFFSSNDQNPDEDNDVPLKLPCNHIMGHACLATWLKHNSSCPLCRATLYEQAPSSSLITNILSQLSDAEFATLSQRTTETLRDAHALDADVNSLARIVVDNAEILERLLEVQRGPQTRESKGGVQEDPGVDGEE